MQPSGAYEAVSYKQPLAPDTKVGLCVTRGVGCRSMLKGSLVVPLLELCCGAVQEQPLQQSDDSVRCAMMGLHEGLKSPSFQGTSRLLRSDLSDEQVKTPPVPCLHQAHQRRWEGCLHLIGCLVQAEHASLSQARTHHSALCVWLLRLLFLV